LIHLRPYAEERKNEASTLRAGRVDNGPLEIAGRKNDVPVSVKVRPADGKNEVLTRFPARSFNDQPDIR
jgi:hypothetical protein